MENQIYLCNLYDYYKELFTEKQQSYFEDYYFENLTQEEIAENHGISKNAISKALLDVKEKLIEYEEKLHLAANKNAIVKLVDSEVYNSIKDYI